MKKLFPDLDGPAFLEALRKEKPVFQHCVWAPDLPNMSTVVLPWTFSAEWLEDQPAEATVDLVPIVAIQASNDLLELWKFGSRSKKRSDALLKAMDGSNARGWQFRDTTLLLTHFTVSEYKEPIEWDEDGETRHGLNHCVVFKMSVDLMLNPKDDDA